VPVATGAATPSAPVLLATLPPGPTPEPSDTPAPTETLDLTPSATVRIDPTYLYFLTVTPTDTPDPYSAAIRIYTPGPMSKVISPIELRAFIESRVAGPTQVELYGEDGRLLYRQVLRTYSFNGQDAHLTMSIPFELRAAGELGRLQISTLDANKRVTALASLHLLLLSAGESQITPPGDLREPVLLDAPRLSQLVSGGEVDVSGKMQPANKLPVFIELVGTDGQVISSRVLTLAPPNGEYQPFDTTVPYHVAGRIPAMLVVRQSDERIPGPFYLYSQPIGLAP
jgi:hypothetical protein